MKKQTRVTKKITYVSKIVAVLDKLEINETFIKGDFIQEQWGTYDFYTDRSFDVALVSARRALPKKKFVSKNKIITRVC